ncbi:MAG: methyltransferase domain-containing protein [Legionellales bacterium]|nr:methyltransferase domain-containing protein [Legionellales bacterium]
MNRTGEQFSQSSQQANVEQHGQQLQQFVLPPSFNDVKMRIQTAYGENTIAKLPNFQGDFINFGYWTDKQLEVKDKGISVEERVEASRRLYSYTVEPLEITHNDLLLEIGFGQGVGTCHINETFSPKGIEAVDITPEQVARANARFSELGSVTFSIGDAESLTFSERTFDKVYSVEVAQHFPNFQEAAFQMARVLKPKGLLSFSAHLATSVSAFNALCKEGLFVNEGIDCLVPMTYVFEALSNAGFVVKQSNDISVQVFPGYDAWFEQKKAEDPTSVTEWTKKIYTAYQRGLIGYYRFFAQKKGDADADAKEQEAAIQLDPTTDKQAQSPNPS